MRRRHRLVAVGCAAAAGLWGAVGCTSVVPEALRAEIDRSVTIAQIARTPEEYRGRTVLLGGEVVRVEPAGPDLELTLAERPLSPLDESPMLTRTSRGDVAVRVSGGARAAIREGQVVTLVGVILGREPGADPQGVPRLEAKHLYVWPVAAVQAPSGGLRW
jgi:outer membrane lipoprotein